MTQSHSRQMVALLIGSGLLFLLIGIGLVVSSTNAVSTQAQLRADGQTVVADVVDAQVARSTRRGSVTSARYEVKYRFQPSGQAAVTSDWQEAPEDVVRAATETRRIEVRYLPTDPSVNLPTASIGSEPGPSGVSIWRMSVGAIFALLGLGVIGLAMKRPRTTEAFPRKPIVPTPAR